jgi:uncharacterized SAM-binding protein YcdF (DUF218 family)
VTWLVAAAAPLGLGAGLGLIIHLRGQRAPTFPARPLTAVVLGARVYPDGTPSPALVDRVALGVELLRRGLARRLVLSGGAPDARPCEAEVMARLAREAGAPADALVLEPKSRSTFDNARECAALLQAGGDTEVLLVSCDFHLARAGAQFRAHGLTVWAVPSRRRLTVADRLTVTGREALSLLRRPWLLARL